MPVSSIDSGLYPDYFASKRLFHPLSPCKMKIYLAYMRIFVYLCAKFQNYGRDLHANAKYP